MSIDWAHFTPWSSLAGGVLIGLSAAAFILLRGRVLGISGILGGLLGARKGDADWRLAFLVGLLAAPSVASLFMAPVVPRVEAGWLTLVLAGLLVGIGTRYGAGCTSGHGVCGIARLSPRSTVATLAFMASGATVVFVTRHLIG